MRTKPIPLHAGPDAADEPTTTDTLTLAGALIAESVAAVVQQAVDNATAPLREEVIALKERLEHPWYGKLLTTYQVAEICSVHYETVLDWTNLPEDHPRRLPFVYLGQQKRILGHELLDWMQRPEARLRMAG